MTIFVAVKGDDFGSGIIRQMVRGFVSPKTGYTHLPALFARRQRRRWLTRGAMLSRTFVKCGERHVFWRQFDI